MLASIESLWRYPVKSMQGESLQSAEIAPDGIAGDRAFALIDGADGKVATAKNPRKWPHLFDFRATLERGTNVWDAVRITLPDGATVSSGQRDVDQILSERLNRSVRLETASQREAISEAYWPDMEELERRDTVTEFGLADGTFFDSAVLHLLTTGTLARLAQLYPQGRFDVRRFRPNVVVGTSGDVADFVENDWTGRELSLGDTVRVSVTGPCGRCVMTTLPQGDLPGDNGILRAAAQHNRANVGVYAAVIRGGTVRPGDVVTLL